MCKSSKPEKKQEPPESRQKSLQSLKERLKDQYRLKRLLERANQAHGLPKSGGSSISPEVQQAVKERAVLKDKDLH